MFIMWTVVHIILEGSYMIFKKFPPLLKFSPNHGLLLICFTKLVDRGERGEGRGERERKCLKLHDDAGDVSVKRTRVCDEIIAFSNCKCDVTNCTD